MKRMLTTLAMTAALAAPALADGNFYIPFGAMIYDYDDSARRLDTNVMPTIGAGYRFDEHWAAEAMVAAGTTDLDLRIGNLEADVLHYRLDGLYFLDAIGDFTPYAVAGLGENRMDYDWIGDRDDLFVNAGAGVLYQLAENFALRGEVRGIHSFDEDNTEAAVNLLAQYTFGSAAAPAPAPAPVVRDGDRDGVADGADSCPNTPPGKRVDNKGCDCDYTLKLNFEFDSAVLTAGDRAQLDPLAAAMKNATHAYAEVAGHTDSRGDDAYNQDLSLRRAQAVIDYLGSQGVDTSQLKAAGYGETEPVDSNDTDAGRAENRRVVLKRTDCAR